MIKKFLIIVIASIIVGLAQVHAYEPARLDSVNQQVMGAQSMSLTNRYPVPSVNDVFRDNILLTLHYMAGDVKGPSNIQWDAVRGDFRHEIVIPAGKVFAFHEDVLPEFEGRVVATTNATFGPQDGFLSSGYLYGDGVCHLASLMNWAARDAGLKVTAPVNHDFAKIPEVDRIYGTSIYFMPGSYAANAQQNVYIENNTDQDVRMVVTYADDKVTVSFVK